MVADNLLESHHPFLWFSLGFREPTRSKGRFSCVSFVFVVTDDPWSIGMSDGIHDPYLVSRTSECFGLLTSDSFHQRGFLVGVHHRASEVLRSCNSSHSFNSVFGSYFLSTAPQMEIHTSEFEFVR